MIVELLLEREAASFHVRFYANNWGASFGIQETTQTSVDCLGNDELLPLEGVCELSPTKRMRRPRKYRDIRPTKEERRPEQFPYVRPS